MSESEDAAAQREALGSPARLTSTSTRRARLWRGMNRYLAAEAEHAHGTGPQGEGDESQPSDAD
jgi:hypothetical protein